MISATNTVTLTQSIESQAFSPSFTSLYNGSFSMPSIPYWLALVSYFALHGIRRDTANNLPLPMAANKLR